MKAYNFNRFDFLDIGKKLKFIGFDIFSLHKLLNDKTLKVNSWFLAAKTSEDINTKIYWQFVSILRIKWPKVGERGIIFLHKDCRLQWKELFFRQSFAFNFISVKSLLYTKVYRACHPLTQLRSTRCYSQGVSNRGI